MKSKFATIIMTTIMFLMIGVFVLLGTILWNELKRLETSIQPEGVQTILSENTNTIDTNIKAPQLIENPFEKIKDGEYSEPEIDYSNVSINKYFYNQLEEEAKIIYKAFETNKENMKTGNYKVELGSSFSELLNQR